MDRRLYKELWAIRFKRMLHLEKKGVHDYESLLKECKDDHRNHAIEPHLERLIQDEKKHVMLVEELIRILERQLD